MEGQIYANRDANQNSGTNTAIGIGMLALAAFGGSKYLKHLSKEGAQSATKKGAAKGSDNIRKVLDKSSVNKNNVKKIGRIDGQMEDLLSERVGYDITKNGYKGTNNFKMNKDGTINRTTVAYTKENPLDTHFKKTTIEAVGRE